MRGELQIIKGQFSNYREIFKNGSDVDKELICKWLCLLIDFIDKQDDRIQELESKMSDVLPDLS